MADSYGDARLTRREALVLGGVAAAGLAAAPRALAAGSANEGQLNIYSWAQYQDPANLKTFAKQAGVKLHTTYYTSNEQLLTQLKTTKGKMSYDPGNKYSVPKDAGVTAFTYRTDRVKSTLNSWKDFFDFLPHAKGLHVN